MRKLRFREFKQLAQDHTGKNRIGHNPQWNPSLRDPKLLSVPNLAGNQEISDGKTAYANIWKQPT